MTGFLIVGGWGMRGTVGQRGVAAGLAKVSDAVSPVGVISTGDHFGRHGVADVRDSAWDESFESVYSSPALQVPWYSVVGEDDHRGSVRAQIAYGEKSARWNLPARYYARFFDPEVLVVFLDTTPLLERYRRGGAEAVDGLIEIDPRIQLGWLRRTLGNSGARWKIVVGHHPVFSGSPNHPVDGELVETLHPLLVACGVSTYVCGHSRDLQHLEADGVEYVISGAGGEAAGSGIVSRTVFAYGGLGFASMAVTANKLRLGFHDESGAVLHSHTIHKAVSTQTDPAVPFH